MPPCICSNGPQGFGDHTVPGTTTQWPATLNMGATFDPALAREWGSAMGAEFWAKGSNIQAHLTPSIHVCSLIRILIFHGQNGFPISK